MIIELMLHRNEGETVMKVWFLMIGLFVGLVVLFLTLYATTKKTHLRVMGDQCSEIVIPTGCRFGAERRQYQNGCIYFTCSKNPLNAGTRPQR